MVAVDVARRRAQLAELTREALVGYGARATIGTMAWGLLVVAAARRDGSVRWLARALLATLALFVVGTQSYTWHRYATYLNARVALMGSSLVPNFHHALWSQRLAMALALGVPVAVAIAFPIALARFGNARAASRATRALEVAALPLALIAFAALAWRGVPTAGWDNGAPPDVLYLTAVGARVESRRTHADVMTELAYLPESRDPLPVSKLTPAPSRPRNVVLVVNESVRAKDYASAFAPACTTNVFTNAAAPKRYGLRQMRAVDSTTAISIAVMGSGLAATEERRALHQAPLVWEYAHAAAIDSGYFTSQNLLFANAGRWLDGMPVSRFITGTEIEPYASYQCGADDAKVLELALADTVELHEPYFAVVQLSNTHFPYWIDDDDAPFTTAGKIARAGLAHDENAELWDRYRDAIRRQDKHLARFLGSLRARERDGARTVVVFVSDHGEQLGEYKEIGHANSMHDVELHVPMWIDAPPGTLAPREEASLRALESTPLTILDVMPTLLDLLGVWDAPEIAGFRARMPGASLLRGGSPPSRAVVITNCTEIFACATKNWGALRGLRKLATTQDEGGPWRCHDLGSDPDEQRDLGEAACADLRELAESGGRGKPW